MKFKKLHSLFLVGIVMFSSFSYAQNIDNQEVLDLKFQEHFFEALKQSTTNNYSKAIENLEKCAAIDTANVAVDFEFSKNYLLLKKYYEAEVFINNALAKEPENRYLLKHKVDILKAQRNYKDAIEVQKQLVKIKPIYTDELVLLYMQNREFSKAEDLITEIENKALTTLKIKRFKNYLINRKKMIKKGTEITKKRSETLENETIESLKNSYKNNKSFSTLLKILNYEVKNNLFEMLYTDSRDALELFPAQPILYQLNGYALNKLKKYNDAIDVLTIGIDFVIDNTQMELNFYNQLIISHEGLNNTKEVIKFKQKAAQLKQVN
jgi:predicted Zn-dependent protease